MAAPIETENTPLIRTDFSDQGAWDALRDVVTTGVQDGSDTFFANVDFIDDRAYAGLGPDEIRALFSDDPMHSIAIVADNIALTSPEMPLLCVELGEPDEDDEDEDDEDDEDPEWAELVNVREIRVVAKQLWTIENNLAVGNMDFVSWVANADADGIFRDWRF
jgi:hypothetical protein